MKAVPWRAGFYVLKWNPPPVFVRDVDLKGGEGEGVDKEEGGRKGGGGGVVHLPLSVPGQKAFVVKE